jgi:hypothetical protein
MERIYNTPDWPHDLTEEQKRDEESAIDREINAICGRLAKRIHEGLMKTFDDIKRQD